MAYSSQNDVLEKFYQRFAASDGSHLRSVRSDHHQYIETMAKKLQAMNPTLYSNIRREFAGSSYDGTSVGQNFDLDTQLVMNCSGLREVESAYPGFVYLYADGATSAQRFSQYAGVNGKLSSAVARSKLFGDLKKCLNDMNRESFDKSVVLRMNGTAIQQDVRGKLVYSIDTVLTLENVSFGGQKLYYIPKPKYGDTFLWRRSYSFKEKSSIIELDKEDNGIRRKLIQILKAVKNQDTSLQSLTSYHMKTAVLVTNDENSSVSWNTQNLAQRFGDIINKLVTTLNQGCLSHFFNSEINLYEDIQSITRINMANRLQRLHPDKSGFNSFFSQ